MKTLLCFTVAPFVLLSSAFSEEGLVDETLDSDTVVCINNDIEGDSMFGILGEYFYNSRANARELEIAEKKTVCLRYHRAKEVKPVFVSTADIVDGALVPDAERVECNRTKGGFAKYYRIELDSNGNKICTVDKNKEEEIIRDLVRGRKAINS